ncbi:Fanconi anemia group B protein [Rhinophrynus dorsalis]
MEESKRFVEESERILAYNGDVLTFKLLQAKGVSGVTDKTTLLFCRRQLETDSGKFVEHFRGEYSFPASKSGLEIVCVCTAADCRTGIILPCILLRTRKKKKSGTSKFNLLLLHNSSEVECLLKFTLDLETVHDLQICDGPTILWRHKEKLHYVSQLSSEAATAPVNFTSIHWAGMVKGQELIVLGIINNSFKDITSKFNLDQTLHCTEFLVYSIEKQKPEPGTCFLPHPYSSVLCCLQVCMVQNLNGKYETSVVAASHKQLICFHNGVPKEVCQLPFENPCKLQLSCTRQGDLFIVSFASGDVCAIWKDSLKIAATWQQVQTILVDDFVGTGSDQILLLLKDDSFKSSDLQSFKLTDCCGIHYPVEPCNTTECSSAEEGFQENRFVTIQALEARLQAGLLSLQELQHNLQVKERVFRSSCEALVEMAQGNTLSVHPAEKEGLVSLWDDMEDSTCPSDLEMSPSSPAECFVEKLWQRIVDNFLVMGLKLTDSAYLSLSNIGLSLIMDQEIALMSQVTKCQTNVLKLTLNSSLVSNADCQTETVAKKQKLECLIKDSISGDCLGRPFQNELEHTVTAVTELSPLLALNNTSCVLLLHARRKNQPDCLLKNERLIVPCGRISLSLEDILKEKHTVNVFEHCQGGGSLEDIFAVLSAFLKCSFHISSSDCTLISVKVWLMGQMQGEPFKQIPEIVCSLRPGSLRGTLFIWNPKTPCEGILTVFYRNHASLLQCLYSLKCVLPPRCVVSIIRQGGNDCLTESLAQSLEEELLALRTSVSSAASQAERELTLRCKTNKKTSNTIDSLSDTKEMVQKYRDELQIEQNQSLLGTPLTTNSNLYRQNIMEIAQIQMNSDRIAGKLAKLPVSH